MPTYTILQRYLYRGNKTWYGRINDGGKISYCSLKTKRKSDAQAWLDAHNAARFFPELVNNIERRGHDARQVYYEFLDAKEAALRNDLSLKRYRNDLKHLLSFGEENGIKLIEDWTTKKAQDFAVYLSKFSPVMVKRVLDMGRQVIKWSIIRYDLNSRNPFEGLERPKIPKRLLEFWTPEEIDRILDATENKEFRLNWAIMAFAGLRHSEARGLRPKDIVNGRIRIIGKGNKEALVPISERLAAEIERAGGLDRRDKEQYSRTGEIVHLKAAAKAAGASGRAFPHKFRHSFVSNLIRAKVGDKFVSELARHSQISTTMNVYGHLLPEDLDDAINALK